jgi:hypothetical protein
VRGDIEIPPPPSCLPYNAALRSAASSAHHGTFKTTTKKAAQPLFQVILQYPAQKLPRPCLFGIAEYLLR